MNEQELRELDAWIAEHVMGLYCGNFNWCKPSGEFVSALHPPSYTTDPAAAMAVLEKCAEKLCIAVFKSASPDNPGWFVETASCGIDEALIRAIAPTLPLAICKFALALFSK